VCDTHSACIHRGGNNDGHGAELPRQSVWYTRSWELAQLVEDERHWTSTLPRTNSSTNQNYSQATVEKCCHFEEGHNLIAIEPSKASNTFA
jgi:hypothetical protein